MENKPNLGGGQSGDDFCRRKVWRFFLNDQIFSVLGVDVIQISGLGGRLGGPGRPEIDRNRSILADFGGSQLNFGGFGVDFGGFWAISGDFGGIWGDLGGSWGVPPYIRGDPPILGGTPPNSRISNPGGGLLGNMYRY